MPKPNLIEEATGLNFENMYIIKNKLIMDPDDSKQTGWNLLLIENAEVVTY